MIPFVRDFMRGYPSSMAWGNLDKEALPDVNFQPHGYLFLATKVMINYDYECKKLPCQVQNFWLISDLIVTSQAGEEVLARNQATQSECGASTVMLDQAFAI